jgi:hypothetical protein
MDKQLANQAEATRTSVSASGAGACQPCCISQNDGD